MTLQYDHKSGPATFEYMTEPVSLWAATAAEKEPGLMPLAGERHADVAIIGGDFTGLSTALHLAQAGTRALFNERIPSRCGCAYRNEAMFDVR